MIKASKKSLQFNAFSHEKPKNILIFTSDTKSSLVSIRLIIPLSAYIAKNNGQLKVIGRNNFSHNDLEWADILIVHREMSIFSIDVVREAYNMGIAIIYDTDDNLSCIPEYSLAKLSHKDIMLTEYVISIANKVTCPTLPLKKELEKKTDSVYIVPNIIQNKDKLTLPDKKHFSTECTLVIASSDTILVDFLVESVKLILKVNPKLNIVTIGNISQKFTGITDKLKQYPLCSHDMFSDILDGLDNAIGLIPLENSLFSSCKSPIKYFHYTSCGVVTVASEVQPYTDFINQKNGLLIENTPLLWAQKVLRLVDNVCQRQQMLTEALHTWKLSGTDAVAILAWEKVFCGVPKPFIVKNKYS